MRPNADVIFAYSLGNEIRSDIVRWHGPRAVNRFLRELYDLGKQSDPEGLFTFSNYPPAEYLDLNFLDIVSFNVYLHREADFRRYLTHLLAATYDRPLVLSETGMDTIREGEAHQAELLGWQARAAFELGLSGFIVFAFTDEWHTGGAEIADWAFGLVTRERQTKQAFDTVGEIFKAELPPPQPQLPKASVVVCAYNAAATLAPCLESLTRLNYPDYEIIVVDDGSTDATASIAEAAGVRAIKDAHRGLSGARNRAIAEAAGRIVAFIDADAEADRDWLYHLVETLEGTGAVAAGGQNFPPDHMSATEAAIAAAPGEPREVRAADDELDQVCGCSMAIDKARLPTPAPFDEAFTTAGDDVDFSWSMQEHGLKLAYAPGATVIHRRRATIGAYLRQQIGYGRGEAILARKYPNRVRMGGRVYGNPGWIARWFVVAPRVYYGAFGRGLFQSLYRGADFPWVLQLPLSISWVLLTVFLLLLGCFAGTMLIVLGLCSVAAMLASASAMAIVRGNARDTSTVTCAVLVLICLMGPITRAFGRSWQALRTRLKVSDDPTHHKPRFQLHGDIPLLDVASPTDESLVPRVSAMLRAGLLKRGASVTMTDGYQPYDLRIETGICAAAKINLLNSRDGRIVVGWKLGFRVTPFGSWMIAAILLVLLLGESRIFGALVGVFTVAIVMIADGRQIPPLLELAVADVMRSLPTGSESSAKGAA
jgi:cellulose synthase/poly-beta-1,6-N-acetylglucosamine synthase-like glycosyltransferase